MATSHGVMKKLFAKKGMFFPIAGFAIIMTLIFMAFGGNLGGLNRQNYSFVKVVGHQFMLDGKPFYINGWNSYWLMDHAVDEISRPRTKEMLQQGSKMGLTVCRTWAFNDGTYHALQLSPGQFDQQTFQALDYVISEARNNGVRVILSLVNNLHAYGGKTQYVQWAWDEGLGISSSNDSFFYDPTTQGYFKHFVKTVLTRKNTITGIEYREDPIILAWELINEPRCTSDPSGDTLQDWIKEMSEYIKTIDEKHLVTIGLEGFYDSNSPKSADNPTKFEGSLGTDFIRNNHIPTIDFASFHMYPDKWVHKNLDEKLEFAKKWISSHFEDGEKQLKKPVILSEFGLSGHTEGFEPGHRDKLIKIVDEITYKSAKSNGAGAGSFMWQFMVKGMEEYNDDFGVIPWELESTYSVMVEQSCRLARLRGSSSLKGSLIDMCRRSEQ
ncbi:mannan endo-1,4-beta-mannosidase 2-like [Silene latifolia]|uniref:mannan endo-1,4-beta-mannosidase 2-like n=1 Tax=Silene latifolia TaxID=37657 RepID=UPI003D783092